jgi:excisionase family DNA binding protein
MQDTPSQLVPSRLMTYAEVADTCGLSIRTVIRAVESGELVCHRFGRATRIAVDEVRRWLETRRGAPSLAYRRTRSRR